MMTEPPTMTTEPPASFLPTWGGEGGQVLGTEAELRAALDSEAANERRIADAEVSASARPKLN